jgi:HD-GYP domain-containing protein (c-di-GMP phosphodiesterase class II)
LLFLDGVIELVEQHHERYDGKGYPFGIKGENIKLGARIMTVADSFDAMITERPYRKAFTKEEAIEELKKCSGTQFDPKVVEAFLKVLEKNPDMLNTLNQV